MNNKSLQSVLVLLVSFTILVMAISMPAQAPGQDPGKHVFLNIVPIGVNKVNSTPGYFANMVTVSAPAGGFFFLNLTIPKGYTFTLPSSGKQVASYTWFNRTNVSKVIIYIISNNTVNETVDVRFSTDSGHTFRTKRDLPIANMVIGGTSLKFTKPTSISNGYINLSLGGFAGPILSRETAEVILAKDMLKNPSTPGKYTWLLEAKNSPGGSAAIDSDTIHIRLK
jgi:hypothetical protein